MEALALNKKRARAISSCPLHRRLLIAYFRVRPFSIGRKRVFPGLRSDKAFQPIEIGVQLPSVGATRPALIKRLTEGTAAVQPVAMIGAAVLYLTVRDHVPAAAV